MTLAPHTATIGRLGEDAACLFLKEKGHSIVARNFRAGHKEIDIISTTPGELHIVEVKTRRGPTDIAPEVNITPSKMASITGAAKSFLKSAIMRTLPPDMEVLFDVVTVVIEESGPKINYYPNAYRATYV